MSYGTLTTVTGPMGSGKTEYIINKHGEIKNEDSEAKIFVFSSKIDTRSKPGYIQSRNKKIKPISCNYIEDFEIGDLENLDKDCVRYVMIDEGQFIDQLKEKVEKFLSWGYNVYVAGLNLDFKRDPFGDICKLMNTSENVVLLKSECKKCGGEAIYTSKIGGDSNKIKESGDLDIYQPTCRTCYASYSNESNIDK